jgi:hypothetical protein
MVLPGLVCGALAVVFGAEVGAGLCAELGAELEVEFVAAAEAGAVATR